jgi:hypothetical protein
MYWAMRVSNAVNRAARSGTSALTTKGWRCRDVLSGDVFEVDSDIQADPVNAEFYPDTATLYPPTKDHAL